MISTHTKIKFGYRYNFVAMRYFAMLFLLISQLGTYFTVMYYGNKVMYGVGYFFDQDYPNLVDVVTTFGMTGWMSTILTAMRACGALVPPLFFAATIAFVLNHKENNIGLATFRNGFLAFLFYLVETFIMVFALVLVIGIVETVFESLRDPAGGFLELANRLLEEIEFIYNGERLLDMEPVISDLKLMASEKLVEIMVKNTPTVNVFLDMFLCLLMTISLCTRPKWVNKQWKLVLWRGLVIIPFGYIIAAFVLHGLYSSGLVALDLELLLLFPAKRIPHFLFFGALLVCTLWQQKSPMRVEEGLHVLNCPQRKIIGDAVTMETRDEAKRRSRAAAIFLSVTLFLICAADFSFTFTSYGANWGLGKSWYAVFCIPFFFLFDDHKPATKRSYKMFTLAYFASMLVIVILYVLLLFVD